MSRRKHIVRPIVPCLAGTALALAHPADVQARETLGGGVVLEWLRNRSKA